MWEEDSSVVKGVFCIIQMMLAVASQMVEESQEMAELSGEADLQERRVRTLSGDFFRERCANANQDGVEVFPSWEKVRGLE